MILKRIEVEGAITENTYFYISKKSNSGVIIDPGAKASKLLEIVKKNGWNIEYILITHGHFDHIGAVNEIHKVLKIPYYIHENGIRYLSDPRYNFSEYYKPKIILDKASYFKDGTVFSVGNGTETENVKFVAIHTPGHTTDSTTFYDASNGVAFVGDTIFKGTIGATYFPGGDQKQMLRSICDRIFRLPDDTKLYSGHTDVTTVKSERIGFGSWMIH